MPLRMPKNLCLLPHFHSRFSVRCRCAHSDVSFGFGIRPFIVQFCSSALGVRWYGFGAIAPVHANPKFLCYRRIAQPRIFLSGKAPHYSRL
jgi:hypothetical protein